MVGFAKQEGALGIFLPTMTNTSQESIENGLSRNYARMVLTDLCKKTTPLSVNLCINFYMKTYGLDTTDDDIKRGLELSFLYGR